MVDFSASLVHRIFLGKNIEDLCQRTLPTSHPNVPAGTPGSLGTCVHKSSCLVPTTSPDLSRFKSECWDRPALAATLFGRMCWDLEADVSSYHLLLDWSQFCNGGSKGDCELVLWPILLPECTLRMAHQRSCHQPSCSCPRKQVTSIE